MSLRQLLVRSLTTVTLLLGASPVFADPLTMAVDARRSTITFTSDAPGERFVGTAGELSGTISTDTANFAATTGTISFPVSSMNTGNTLRDRHMRGSDWLNADANPQISFTIERLEGVATSTNGNRTDVTATAHGQVTVNGVTAPATATVTVALNAETKTGRVQTTFAVSLANHNVTGADNAIGSSVGETIDIEGTVYTSWE